MAPSHVDRTRPKNPFVPGVAKMPPHFGRRPAVDSVLENVSINLQATIGPSTVIGPDYVYLYGPRGTGKTVQLNAFQEQIRQRDNPDILLELSPSMVRTEETMLRYLFAPAIEMTGLHKSQHSPESTLNIRKALARARQWVRQFRPLDSYLTRHVQNLRPQEARVFAGFGVVNMVLPGEPDISAGQSLRRLGGPVLITLDEAHTVEPAALAVLLEAVQEAGKYIPIALMLAGTPDLPDVLQQVGTTFWVRGQQLPIGRLASEAAHDVIECPLLDADMTCNPTAVDDLVAAADYYPWFLQLYGREAFEVMQQEAVLHFDEAECQAAIERTRIPRQNYYARLRKEFRSTDERSLARTVALTFKKRNGSLTTDELEALLDGMNPERAEAREAHLRHAGFIVEGQEPDTWEPGIPSFMDYMIAATEPRTCSSVPSTS